MKQAPNRNVIQGRGPRGWRSKGWVSGFLRQEDGGAAIMTGLAIPVLLGSAGLALEYGQLLVVRAEAQRTSDLASHAGAVAYGRTGDTGPMTDAARAVARLNGFADKDIAVTLDPSVAAASGAAVRATISVEKPLFLPRLVGGETSVEVVASAVAGTLPGEPACVQALDPGGGGISLSGGTSLRTEECAVASNAEVEAPCGTSIVTNSLSYDSASPPRTGSCGTITKPEGGAAEIVRRATPDPLAGTEAIMLAATQMDRTAALAPPEQVVVAPGSNMDFGWDQNATKAQAEALGCSATFSQAVWTFSCLGRSTVNLGRVTLGGGLTLRFNPGGGENVTYNLSGEIRNNGARMTFAGGTYNVAGGIITGGGSVTEFGAGTYRIGRASHYCSGARYSICNTSRLVFDGSSSFVLPGGIRNDGGASLTLGTGAGNDFRLGPSSNGNAISLGGGSQTYMGDAESGVFEVAGRIDGGGGGSCMMLPAAPLHEINGSIVASGAIRFGGGLYAVNGYMHMGGNGGGSAECGGETISIEAIGATFLISGAGQEPPGWECRGQAFCVSADYSNLRITAPQSGPFTDLAVIGPLDPARQAGALFTSGASGSVVSGAFYFPNGPIATSGGASADSGGDGCLQLIGSEISMSGGTALASECRLPKAGTVGQVVILR